MLTPRAQVVQSHHYVMQTLTLAKAEVGSARKLAGGWLKDAWERHRQRKKGGGSSGLAAPTQRQSCKEKLRKLGAGAFQEARQGLHSGTKLTSPWAKGGRSCGPGTVSKAGLADEAETEADASLPGCAGTG